MSYILLLWNNPVVRTILKYVGFVCFGLVVGYTYGSYSEKNRQLEQSLKVAANVTRQIEKRTERNNEILALKESEVIKVSNENVRLKERLRKNEKLINDTNVIRRNWVRSIEPTYMSESTGTASRRSTASDDLRTVPASTVAAYVLYLKEHGELCRIKQNSLVRSVKH